jgi:prepilin signal peptidase PulO-like enzyme (type II secretory pathway)
MTIAIPIVTSFDGKGISSAVKEFKNLETNGEKAQFAIKKAAVPAAAALAGLTAALGSAVKGAIEDAAAQDKLAEQIRRTTGATDAQITANEDWISVQGRLLGVTDDELRPALGGLVRATGSITKAQELASAAMDISAAKGLSLETTTKALEKAYGGNMTALAKLSPELRDMIKGGADLDEVMGAMSETFGGAASEAAETTAGKFARMKLALDETKESIGASLMPVVEAIIPILQKFSDWAAKHPEVFTILGVALAGIAAAIVAINIAMSINPITAIAIGIGLVAAAAVIAYKKFETFRTIVDALFGAVRWWISNVTIPLFQGLLGAATFVFKAIAAIWNNTVGKLAFTIPDWVPLLGGKSFAMPKIGGGGGSSGGLTSARAFEESQKEIIAANPEVFAAPPAVAPSAPGKVQNTAAPAFDKTSGNAGGFENAGIGGIGPFSNITINMDAGLVSSPATVGQDIIDAILAAQRNSGQVFAPAVTF